MTWHSPKWMNWEPCFLSLPSSVGHVHIYARTLLMHSLILYERRCGKSMRHICEDSHGVCGAQWGSITRWQMYVWRLSFALAALHDLVGPQQ